MFKNFEIKFSTSTTQFLLGYRYEPTGMKSADHSIYIGPFTITVILHS